MAKTVIKKNGKKQKFNQKKLQRSIKLAAEQVKLTSGIQNTIVKKTMKEVLFYLDSIDEVTTAQIRDIVLYHLRSMNPAVVRAWLAYEMMKLSRKKFEI